MHQLEQPELKVEALLLLVADVAVSAEHDLQEAREIFFAEQGGNARDARLLVGRDLQQR